MPMPLADFIVDNIEEILEEWVEFARTLSSATELDLEALRDHAEIMLRTVAAEMKDPQSAAKQQAKSRGGAPPDPSGEETAAQTHGNQRYAQGFTLRELVAEYRALRATVIRLWMRDQSIDERGVHELTRFNEGIDQLLAESVFNFSHDLDRARELFMGVLGHDLRTDLHVILSCADRLERKPLQQQVESYVPHIRASAKNILTMAEDLLDVARTQLGSRLPVDADQADLTIVVEDVLRAFRELHPKAQIRVQIDGDVQGRWDQKRIQQLLGNLVRNALEHGDKERPVTVSAQGRDDDVIVKVHNYGTAIPRSRMAHMFDPMKRSNDQTGRAGVGLGLYIASTIAQAHGGTLTVTSSEADGTTFTATLPRSERVAVD